MCMHVFMYVDISVCVLDRFLILCIFLIGVFFSGWGGEFMYATCPGDIFYFMLCIHWLNLSLEKLFIFNGTDELTATLTGAETEVSLSS